MQIIEYQTTKTKNVLRSIMYSIINSNDSIIEKLIPSLTGARHSIYPDGPINTKYYEIHHYKITLPKHMPIDIENIIKSLPERLKDVAMTSAIDLLDKKEIVLVSYRPLTVK